MLKRHRIILAYCAVLLLVIITTVSLLSSDDNRIVNINSADLKSYLFKDSPKADSDDDKKKEQEQEQKNENENEKDKEQERAGPLGNSNEEASAKGGDDSNENKDSAEHEKLPDLFPKEGDVDRYVERVINGDSYADKVEISKMTDEEILERLKQHKKTQPLPDKPSIKIADDANIDQYDNIKDTKIDNDKRTRSDDAPDSQPWAKYEIDRKIPGHDTNADIPHPRENATLFTICRNSEIYGILDSIQQLEARFNGKHHYDWVFLNDEPFSEEFISLTSNMVSGRARYGLIPRRHWSYPSYIDQNKAKEIRESRKWASITYGNSESYRHMCRFNSMFFYKHPIMEEYQYYWRVEPEVNYHCDILTDPFKLLREQNKKYGFTISMRELPNTIESLWESTRLYFRELTTDYFDSKAQNNLLDFISDDSGESYNLCHYWSNFEIADLDIFRSEVYEGYVNHLDHAGGFFYERWGDAPIHSIIFSLILKKNEVHLFQDISYEHTVGKSCPLDDAFHKQARCTCDPEDNWVIRSESSCNNRFIDVSGMERQKNYDEFVRRIEEKKRKEQELKDEQRKLRVEAARRQSDARRQKAEERRKHRLEAQKKRKDEQKAAQN